MLWAQLFYLCRPYATLVELGIGREGLVRGSERSRGGRCWGKRNRPRCAWWPCPLVLFSLDCKAFLNLVIHDNPFWCRIPNLVKVKPLFITWCSSLFSCFPNSLSSRLLLQGSFIIFDYRFAVCTRVSFALTNKEKDFALGNDKFKLIFQLLMKH